MKPINKSHEPSSLIQYRNSENSSYDDYPMKDSLRRALVDEQSGLCCYCMGRIEPCSKKMRIEHWRSRARYPDEQLKYVNLLGACQGGHGQPPEKQHCDVRKGSEDIKYNPANRRDHHAFETIGYGIHGGIYSGDSEFNEQLDNTLNLNMDAIKNRRKRELDQIRKWYKKRSPNRTQLEAELLSRETSPSPYPVSIWFLKDQLKKFR